MWHKRFDADLNGRRADRVFYLVIVIHCGVYATDLYVFDRPPPETRPEIIEQIDHAC